MTPTKFVTIPNGYDGAEWETMSAHDVDASAASAGKFVITYAGNFYHKRSPLPLFRGLRTLMDSGDIAAERIQVDLIGHCAVAEGTRVTEMVAQCGLSGCVNVTGPLSRAETLRRVARSNLLLLLAEGLTSQIPGKTYEYLRAGPPILALTADGAVAELLRRTGGAWIIEPANAPGLAAALLEAYRCWQSGARGPRPDPAVVEGFDRRVLAGRFAAVLDARIAGVAPGRLGKTTVSPTVDADVPRGHTRYEGPPAEGHGGRDRAILVSDDGGRAHHSE
jgi:glycosyltransferase involved in cell wall biosynthesis